MNYYLFENFNLIKCEMCGLAQLNPGWTHMKRLLDRDSVLIFGKKNSTLISSNGVELKVQPGKIILLPAGEFHFGTEQINKTASYYWLHFYSDKLPVRLDEKDSALLLQDPEIAYQRLDNSIIFPQELTVNVPTQIENQFKNILAEYKNPYFSKSVLHVLTQELLLNISSQCFSSKSDKSVTQDSLIQKIIFQIHDRLWDKNLSVKIIGDILGFNCDYIGRVFKEYMDMSIGQYISQKRVEFSCHLLRETFDSINDVFTQCGFGSRRQFYDEFKKETGTTPVKYRQQSSIINMNIL